MLRSVEASPCYDLSASLDTARGYTITTGLEIYLYLCLFTRSNTLQEEGGVIFVAGSNKPVTVLECGFYYCKTTDDGGAMYLNNINELNVSNCCAYECAVTASGKMGHFVRSVAINFQASFKYNSFHRCSTQTTVGESAVFLYSPSSLTYTNFSRNQAYTGSALKLYYGINALNWCQFYNNTGKNVGLLNVAVTNGGKTTTISNSEILYSKSETDGYSIVMSINDLTFDSCFFAANGILLFKIISTGVIKVKNSVLYHDVNSMGAFTEQENVTYGMLMNFIPLDYTPCIVYFPPTVEATPEMSPLMTTVEETPMQTPIETPFDTLAPTPEETLKETLIPTIKETLNETPFDTLAPTPEETLKETLIPTIKETLSETLIDTVYPTISNTMDPSPEYTMLMTPSNSPIPDETKSSNVLVTILGISGGIALLGVSIFIFRKWDSLFETPSESEKNEV